jgi:translation initiation factor 3 subunit L
MTEYEEEVYEEKPVPDEIRNLLRNLLRALHNHHNRNHAFDKIYDEVQQISGLYANNTWPSIESVYELLKDENDEYGQMTKELYKEIYYRHLHKYLEPTLGERLDAYQAYIDLFNHFLRFPPEESLPSHSNSNSQFTLDLPHNWMWDMLDGFIDQYQSFHIYRAKLTVSASTEELQQELTDVNSNPDTWSTQTVLRYLHSFVRHANINLSNVDGETINTNNDIRTSFCSVFGYMSCVGLLRVHTIMCDYATALASLEPIDLRRHRPLFSAVIGWYVTLYYQLGFSFLMLRRYSDAIKIFSYFLVFVNRQRNTFNRSPNAVQLTKVVDQMTGLLCIAYALSAVNLEDSVITEMKEAHGDRLMRMIRGEIGAFEESFAECSPVFLNLSPSLLVDGASVDQGALQWQLLSIDINQRLSLPPLVSYLRLFSSISTAKLGKFLGMQEEDRVLAMLAMLIHKSRQQRMAGGSPANSKFVYSVILSDLRDRAERLARNERSREGDNSAIEFTMEKDGVNVTQPKSVRRYGEFFMKHYARFDEIARDVMALKR